MSDDLWDEVLARVEGKVNRHSFATWFRPTTFLSQEGSTLRVGVPNAQFREWLTKNYLGVLQEALAEVGQPGLRVSFEETGDDGGAVAIAASSACGRHTRHAGNPVPTGRSFATWRHDSKPD